MKPTTQEASLVVVVAALPLFTYPLSWLPGSIGQFRYFFAVPWPAVILAVAVLLAAGAFFLGRAVSWPRRLVFPVLLLVVSWLLAVRFSSHPHFSLAALPVMAGNLAVFALAQRVEGRQLRRLCWVWLTIAGVVALNGLARLGSESEFVSTIGNRNFLAAYLAAAVVIGWGLADWRAVAATVPLLAALVFCGSRGAWLALIVTGLALLVVVARRRGWLVILLVALTGAGVFFARDYVVRQWRTDVRPVIWASTAQMIAARPLLGHGLDTFWVAYAQYRSPEYFLRPKAANLTDHAHNELLEIAAEQGLFGWGAMLWLGAVAVGRGIRSARRATGQRGVYCGLLGAVAVFVLHGLVDVDLRFAPNQTLLWLLLGLLAGGDDAAPLRVALRLPVLRWTAGMAGLLGAAGVLHGAVLQPVRAGTWERRARLAEARGDLTAAIVAAQESLRFQPLRLGTRYYLAGLLARHAPTRSQAIAECHRINELAPDYGDITFNLGQLYLIEGQTAAAIPHLQRAVIINPYNAEKRALLAHALARLGQPQAAQEQARAALRLQPGQADAQRLLEELSARPVP